MGKLRLKLEVSATETRKYAEVTIGTYEVEFDVEELPRDKPIKWVQRIENECGTTLGGKIVFLDGIEVEPRVRFLS